MTRAAVFSRVSLLLLACGIAGSAAAQEIHVRINNRLSSATSRPGSTFDGVLARATTINGRTCAKGSPARGRVTESKPSGRLSNSGLLEVELVSVSCGGRSYQVSVEPVRLEGKSHTKNNAVLIGGGAAAGAVLGGIMGGGKGALIGGAIGAGAGTATAAATGKREAVIESEAVVAWVVRGSQRGYDDGEVIRSDADGRRRLRSDDDDRYRDDRYRDDRYRDDGRYIEFSSRDRDYIRTCLGNSGYRWNRGLPPGLAKKGKVPPGHAKRLQRNSAIPPGLEMMSLPGTCSGRLPRLPVNWARFVIGDQVVLVSPQRIIVDLFLLGD